MKRGSGVVVVLLWLIGNSPVFAQVDLTGVWINKRLHENNSEEAAVGDYAGVPLTAAARLRAESWSASLLTLPEHQCAPHGSDRVDNFTNLRIWPEIELEAQKLIAYHMNVEWMNPHRVIFMDGRAHPPEYAPHTYMGFSTGRWDGNTLVVTTTHLKASWLKRNGIPRSERATSNDTFGTATTWCR